MQSQRALHASQHRSWPSISRPRSLQFNSRPSTSLITEPAGTNFDTKSPTWSNVVSSQPPTPKEEHTTLATNPRMTLKVPRSFHASTSPAASLENHDSCNDASEPDLCGSLYESEKSYTGLSWPKKIPQTPSYKWDEHYLVDSEAQYAQEATELMKQGLSCAARNGLLRAINAREDNRASRDKAEAKANQGEGKYQLSGLRGLRAAVQAAALEGAARIGSGENNKVRSDRIAAFNAGKCITDISPTKRTYVDEKKRKPIIPFNHVHSNCQNWLTNCEEIDWADHQRCIRQAIESYTVSDDSKEVLNTTNYDTDGAYETDYEANEYGHDSPGLYANNLNEDIIAGGQPFLPTLASFYQPASHEREGSWTTSKTWVSDEEKERTRWQACRDIMKHAGFDQSPFVPLTYEEYLKLKLATAAAKKEAASELLRQREEYAAAVRRHIAAGKPLEQLDSDLTLSRFKTNQKTYRDGLFSGLGRPTIWSAGAHRYPHVAWPSVKQLKAGGDERAKSGHHRILPVSHLEELNDQGFAYVAKGPYVIPVQGPEVPWKYPGAAGWAFHSLRYEDMLAYEAQMFGDPTQQAHAIIGVRFGYIGSSDFEQRLRRFSFRDVLGLIHLGPHGLFWCICYPSDAFFQCDYVLEEG
ncbi:hypothetical protein F5Y19DRAFT_483614 [Xylariaceae sp. FL1651]|nr:hypothetical protein F5Y19DRAFT_483614 [Xylariaceae sp. FL1651]